MDNAIHTENITKSYGDVTALNGINLTIEKGEFYGLIGMNGAGKTTLIDILTGRVTPDDGTAEVLGIDPVVSGDEVRDVVGIIPENDPPLDNLTPDEYFRFVGQVRDLDPQVVTERAMDWAETLSFEDKMNIQNKDLSQGQKQKVRLTAAFLHEPELIFIDEPLVNLDPIVQEKVKDKFRKYNDDGNTIVMSTHYTEAVYDLCSKIGMIKHGEILEEQDVNELTDHTEITDILTGDYYEK